MATRLKEGMIPYTGGIGIEITDNHVINVLLRALNNLIHVNEDRELYVDLQIPDGVEPDYDFEVGVTTGRILEEDGWPQNATILNRKTTSGDYVRLIYAADDKLYYDPGTGEWRLLATWEMIEDITADSNTKTFWIEDNQDLTNAQAAYDWYTSGKNAILIHEGVAGYEMYSLASDGIVGPGIHELDFAGAEQPTVYTGGAWAGQTRVAAPTIHLQAQDGTVNSIIFQDWRGYGFIDPEASYPTPFIPTDDADPTTKKYVDDGLATKQDKLIAGANISIAQDGKTISATIPQALVYKGSVNGLADLPSSGQTVGDTYFVEGEDGMYSWDGTQWSYVGGSGIDTTNLFNKTIDTSDDIVQGTTNLFVTSTEKNYWNGKQDALTAGANIQISNNVISATDTKYSAGTAMELVGNTFNNTKPFDPENAGTLSQVLKKTSTGYRWANEANAVTSVNGQTGDVIVDEFDPENAGSTGQVLKKTGTGYRRSNESVQSVNGSTGNVSINEFDPQNSGSTGQVLKKTSTGYSWQNESGGGGGGSYTAGDGISISNNVITNTKPFDPSTGGATGQVLTKTANGYNWQTIAAGEGNVKLFTLSSTSDTTTAQDVLDWTLAGKMPIIKLNNGVHDVYYTLHQHNSTQHSLEFSAYMGKGIGSGYTYQVYSEVYIYYNGTTVTHIVRDQDEVNKTWVGTQAQYNALGTYENGVVYNIIPS